MQETKPAASDNSYCDFSSHRGQNKWTSLASITQCERHEFGAATKAPGNVETESLTTSSPLGERMILLYRTYCFSARCRIGSVRCGAPVEAWRSGPILQNCSPVQKSRHHKRPLLYAFLSPVAKLLLVTDLAQFGDLLWPTPGQGLFGRRAFVLENTRTSSEHGDVGTPPVFRNLG